MSNKQFLILIGVIVVSALTLFTHYAFSVVYYPPSASLAPNDITSSHIKDDTILDADIASSSAIAPSKINFATTTSITGDLLVGTTTDNGIFYVGTSTTPIFTITSEGYVGIGTSSPNALFNVGTGGEAFQINGIGTITDGTWNGNIIGSLFGGTGADLSAQATGSVAYFTSGGIMGSLAPGNSGQVLMTNGSGAAPSWTNMSATTTKAMVTFSGNTTATSSATNPIEFNVVVYDTDSAYNVAAYTYTVPSAGYYRVEIQSQFTHAGTSGDAGVHIYWNGNSTSSAVYSLGTGDTIGRSATQKTMYLAQGDTLQFWTENNIGAALTYINADAGTYATITRLSD